MDPADILSVPEREEIVSTLRSATDEGRAVWYLMPADRESDTFGLDMGTHKYVLYPKDDDGVAPFNLDIFQEDGTRLALIFSTPRDRQNYSPTVNASLRYIYETLYRKFNRPEESVSKLMSEIHELESGNEPPF